MMAICFAVPELLKRRAIVDPLEKLANLLPTELDILAIYKVPKEKRSRVTDGRRTYPGVVMAGLVVGER